MNFTDEGEVGFLASDDAPVPVEPEPVGEPFYSVLISSAEDGVYRLSVEMGLKADPDTRMWYAAAALGAVGLLLCVCVRLVVLLRWRQRARNNMLAVEMAETAPEDDHSDHEGEQRNDLRAAAPGDSDFEDESVEASPRKNRRV